MTIKLDPYSGTATDTSLNSMGAGVGSIPSINGMNPQSALSSNFLHFQILNKITSNLDFIKTGDDFVDQIVFVILQGFILSMIVNLTMQVGTFIKNFNAKKIFIKSL